MAHLAGHNIIDLATWRDQTYGKVKLGRENLHRYQNKAVRFLISTSKSALFLDVGMGKTAICLTLIADLLNTGWNGHVLIIAPLRVARSTWPNEIPEWKQSAGLDFVLIRAEDDDDEIKEAYQSAYNDNLPRQLSVGETKKDAAKFASVHARAARQRAKEAMKGRQASSLPTVSIINVEALPWLVEYWWKRGGKWPYDTVFIDESSKFKAWQTERFNCLQRVLPAVERLHLLTASPAPESYLDLFAQIFLLDGGHRLGRNITNFRHKYFHNPSRKAFRKWIINSGAEEKISDKISDLCLVMKAKDHRDELKVEEHLPIKRHITLNSEMMDSYRRFENTSILHINDNEIEAVNSAVLMNKLLQVSAGAIYDENKRVIPVHDEKIEALKELIEELQGEPLMVAYWYKSTLDRLKKAFPHARVMTGNSKKTEDDWNAGKIDLLLVHPAAAGHGLNLQKGPGHDLCFFDIPWSREAYEQTIGRLARQGQKAMVRVFHLLIIGTADEIVYDALLDKGYGQERLFNYIRTARARDAANDNRREERRRKAA